MVSGDRARAAARAARCSSRCCRRAPAGERFARRRRRTAGRPRACAAGAPIGRASVVAPAASMHSKATLDADVVSQAPTEHGGRPRARGRLGARQHVRRVRGVGAAGRHPVAAPGGAGLRSGRQRPPRHEPVRQPLSRAQRHAAQADGGRSARDGPRGRRADRPGPRCRDNGRNAGGADARSALADGPASGSSSGLGAAW